MGEFAVVDIFCEDARHETYARALVSRLALEENLEVAIEVRSAHGGSSKMVAEFKAYQKLRETVPGTPDLLVLMADADNHGWQQRRTALSNLIDKTIFPRGVAIVPDPEVEEWYLADPAAISELGANPTPVGTDPKERLQNAFADVFLLRDGIELGREVVNALDLGRAAQRAPSLVAAVDDIRAELKLIRVALGL